MSDISPKDGKDFKKPSSVSGDSKDSLSVANHPDGNTTSQKPNGQGSSSSSSNSNSSNSSSSNSSNSSNRQGQQQTGQQQQGNQQQTGQQTGNNGGNALTRLFHLNSVFDFFKAS